MKKKIKIIIIIIIIKSPNFLSGKSWIFLNKRFAYAPSKIEHQSCLHLNNIYVGTWHLNTWFNFVPNPEVLIYKIHPLPLIFLLRSFAFLFSALLFVDFLLPMFLWSTRMNLHCTFVSYAKNRARLLDQSS